ncbi:MAG: cyclic nucleotide-binding domain-containing protein [Thermoleophilia bacterium]|nr:cyclic nucleotide-binding domain-containing protein [Thermoleophilia bacterium]MDH5332376.1 cyclic nucleotide-binding domain-containing protein [Thermoleophilia bacterium]
MAKPSADLIRGIPLFSDLSESDAEQLASDFVERKFAAGQAIATEGEGGLNFFVVDSGEATVSVGGREVAKLTAGDPFGEIALVDKSARSATVTADTDMRVWGLPIWSFRPFVETRPVVLWKLLEILADRLRTAQARG